MTDVLLSHTLEPVTARSDCRRKHKEQPASKTTRAHVNVSWHSPRPHVSSDRRTFANCFCECHSVTVKTSILETRIAWPLHGHAHTNNFVSLLTLDVEAHNAASTTQSLMIAPCRWRCAGWPIVFHCHVVSFPERNDFQRSDEGHRNIQQNSEYYQQMSSISSSLMSVHLLFDFKSDGTTIKAPTEISFFQNFPFKFRFDLHVGAHRFITSIPHTLTSSSNDTNSTSQGRPTPLSTKSANNPSTPSLWPLHKPRRRTLILP